MCFSATASFTAGAVLCSVGVASVKKAESTSEIPFASIPFIFGLQQLTEGFIWLGLTNPEYEFLLSGTTHLFILFAQVVWPFWVPLATYLFQTKSTGIRKGLFKILTVIGAGVAILLGYYLINFPVNAEILGDHIKYIQDYPRDFRWLVSILYGLVTIIPPFVDRDFRMRVLASAIFISYLITEIFYSQFIVSVWCYFAAVLSILVLWIVYGRRREENRN